MRHVSFAILFLAFFTFSLQSKASELGRNFGSADCGISIGCPTSVDASYFSGYITDLSSQANRCVGRYFGKSTSGGYFEQTYLETKALPPNPNGGATLAPHCCVVEDSKNPNGTRCRLMCSIHESR